MHIALVDPSRVTLKMVTALLETRHHRVSAFTDSQAALDHVRRDDGVDCVITSLETAPLGGLEVCWNLRALSDERRPLAILVMSSDRGRRDIGEVLDCGADDFMAKPPDPDELHARLRNAERVIRLQRELIEQADTDPLTRLLNRRAFTRKARDAMGRAGETGTISALLVDIDHFKGINDTHGHDAGDVIIRNVADILRETGGVAARLGGEEFGMCLPEVSLATASIVAHRIRTRCASLHETKRGLPTRFTVSLGLTEWDHAESVDDLLKRTDIALYAAKRGGRNRVAMAGAGSITECLS